MVTFERCHRYDFQVTQAQPGFNDATFLLGRSSGITRFVLLRDLHFGINANPMDRYNVSSGCVSQLPSVSTRVHAWCTLYLVFSETRADGKIRCSINRVPVKGFRWLKIFIVYEATNCMGKINNVAQFSSGSC